MTKDEANKLFAKLLLRGLDATPTQAAVLMAEMAAFNLHQEMASWVADFYEKEDALTLQSFTKKVDEFIAQKQHQTPSK